MKTTETINKLSENNKKQMSQVTQKGFVEKKLSDKNNDPLDQQLNISIKNNYFFEKPLYDQ